MNILIKLMSIVALVIAPHIAAEPRADDDLDQSNPEVTQPIAQAAQPAAPVAVLAR
jgi:hypothetical protein